MTPLFAMLSVKTPRSIPRPQQPHTSPPSPSIPRTLPRPIPLRPPQPRILQQDPKQRNLHIHRPPRPPRPRAPLRRDRPPDLLPRRRLDEEAQRLGQLAHPQRDGDVVHPRREEVVVPLLEDGHFEDGAAGVQEALEALRVAGAVDVQDEFAAVGGGHAFVRGEGEAGGGVAHAVAFFGGAVARVGEADVDVFREGFHSARVGLPRAALLVFPEEGYGFALVVEVPDESEAVACSPAVVGEEAVRRTAGPV